MTTTHLLFDLETVLDTDLAAKCGYQPEKTKNGDEKFHPHIFHNPCAIAVGYVTEHVLTQVESLHGFMDATDPQSLTEAFWRVASPVPIWVSFNGRSFDIKVMEKCSLFYGIPAPRHWQGGTKGTRYRYSEAHQDLFAILTDGNYGGKGYSLDQLMLGLGYAGKGDVTGADVQRLFNEGKLETIEVYNRADVVRLYALWLSMERVAGHLTQAQYQAALAQSKPWLDQIR